MWMDIQIVYLLVTYDLLLRSAALLWPIQIISFLFVGLKDRVRNPSDIPHVKDACGPKGPTGKSSLLGWMTLVTSNVMVQKICIMHGVRKWFYVKFTFAVSEPIPVLCIIILYCASGCLFVCVCFNFWCVVCIAFAQNQQDRKHNFCIPFSFTQQWIISNCAHRTLTHTFIKLCPVPGGWSSKGLRICLVVVVVAYLLATATITRQSGFITDRTAHEWMRISMCCMRFDERARCYKHGWRSDGTVPRG